MEQLIHQSVKRNMRLTRSTDFERVRRFGKSYAHPLIVLVALPNEERKSRFGVSAGRSLGNAVQRNRAKRLLREALRPVIGAIAPGWDLLLLARSPVNEAKLQNVEAALQDLLNRANVMNKSDGQ